MGAPNEDHPSDRSEILKLMHETALREYSDELARTKDLDSKTTPMVAATGALLVFAAGMLGKPPADLPEFWKGVYFTVNVLVLIVLAGAELLFLSVLWGRTFQRLSLKDVVSPGWKSADELREQLAETYRNLVATNTFVNEAKAARYKQGIIWLTVGLAMLIVLLLAAGAAVAIVAKGGI